MALVCLPLLNLPEALHIIEKQCNLISDSTNKIAMCLDEHLHQLIIQTIK